jgi:two-component system, NtrC family, sensor kinase
MPKPDAVAAGGEMRVHKLRSLSAKLIMLLVPPMILFLGLLGYLDIRLHRQQLEKNTLASAERVSDVIKRNASYYMLRNERDGLYHLINEIGNEPGVVRIRIINQQGRISFSSDTKETSTFVDKRTEACYGCHSQSQPLTHLDRPDRFRIYRLPTGERALGIINPIENSPACSNTACHAHPRNQKILGVLDTNLSLKATDANLAQATRQMVLYTVLALLVTSALIPLFIWKVVHGPLKALKKGTEHLASGDLGYQLPIETSDELAGVATSFNTMSRQLRDAQAEIDAAQKKLEERIAQKTSELNRAHDQMLRVEKMASIGKLSAVVAHEINNPLAGILTYAKLLKKQCARGEAGEGSTKREEILSSLELIEQESRRCGEILKNLMTFARSTPMNYEPADLNAVIDRSVRLVQHQLQLSGNELHLDLAAGLEPVRCDPAQIEQVIVSLIMNAIDAMPAGGNLILRTRLLAGSSRVQIQVQDNGVGISPELLPNLFEPFFTTKERGHGLGLGLAISRNIVERHQGKIDVVSEPGHGSLFTVTLPVNGASGSSARAPRLREE